MAHPATLFRSVLGAAILGAAVVTPLKVQGQTLTDVALSQEAQIAARLRALPAAELKAFYLGCSREAGRRVLGFGEAAMCSIGYETLLQHAFGGDFLALLAWSRAQDASAGLGTK